MKRDRRKILRAAEESDEVLARLAVHAPVVLEVLHHAVQEEDGAKVHDEHQQDTVPEQGHNGADDGADHKSSVVCYI